MEGVQPPILTEYNQSYKMEVMAANIVNLFAYLVDIVAVGGSSPASNSNTNKP